MSEQKPIPVADALKALRMAQEFVSDFSAEPRWLAIDGVLMFEGGNRMTTQDDDDFIVMARAVLPGMVADLTDQVVHYQDEAIGPNDHVYPSVAPIVQWARTREEWSK